MPRKHLLSASLVWTLAASACVVGDVGDLPEGAVELDAIPGEEVDIDGITVVAPPRGEGVWTEWIFEDGVTQTLIVESLQDGRVVLLPPPLETEGDGDGEAASTSSAASAPGPCSDKAYALLPWKWNQRFDWWFNAPSTPSGMSKDNVENRLKRAATNITRSDNNCGMADQVGATHRYEGRKSVGVQIRANGTCNSGNGINSVGFGDLPAGVLGVACVWYSGGAAVEGDIRLNKADHKWRASLSGCTNQWSVEAVATHEMGHVFGLGHVGESAHGNLTMSTHINGTCQNAEASLGRGDVRGLRAKY